MPRYEYKIVLAPEKAGKFKGLKSPARFAATIEQAMNELGAEGWQFLRVDTLPQEERSGLTSKVHTPRNLLIFQREIVEAVVEEEALPEPELPPVPTFSQAPAEPAPLAAALAIEPDPSPDPVSQPIAAQDQEVTR